MVNMKELKELMEKVPVWKDAAGAPEWMNELEARLHALEAQAAGAREDARGTGDTCPCCNTPSGRIFRIDKDPILGDIGGMMHYFECTACNKYYNRPVAD